MQAFTESKWDNKFGMVENNSPHFEFSDLEDSYTQRMKEQDKAMENIMLEGVGKDAEVITNASGGKQSKAPIAMHLVDPDFLYGWFNGLIPDLSCKDDVIREITQFMKFGDKGNLLSAIFEVNCIYSEDTNENRAIVTIAKVLKEGAEKYKPNNWRLISEEEHLNHALIHYMAYLLGDTQDNHLEHCMCRLMMAYATKKTEGFSYTEYKG